MTKEMSAAEKARIRKVFATAMKKAGIKPTDADPCECGHDYIDHTLRRGEMECTICTCNHFNGKL